MKILGYLLITISFLAASYYSVVDVEVVPWTRVIPALVLGLIGVGAVQISSRGHRRSADRVRSNMGKYAVSLWNEKLLTQRCVPRPVPVDRPHSWSCAAGARLSASRSCRSSPRAVVQQLRAEREPPAPKSSSHRQLQWKGDDRSERVARQRCGG